MDEVGKNGEPLAAAIKQCIVVVEGVPYILHFIEFDFALLLF